MFALQQAQWSASPDTPRKSYRLSMFALQHSPNLLEVTYFTCYRLSMFALQPFASTIDNLGQCYRLSMFALQLQHIFAQSVTVTA